MATNFILFTNVKFARQNTYNKYFTIFVTLTKKLIKFCPVLFALLFDQGNKKFLPQSARKCISEGLISKFFWGACPQTPLEAQALRAFAYMAYGHVIHVTGDI